MEKTCPSCGSVNREEFDSEIAMLLQFSTDTRLPSKFLFVPICVCLDCGRAELVVPEDKRRELVTQGARAPQLNRG
jgi:hypothetical protein